MTRRTPLKTRPVIFGEALFDIFPGGEEILGGAPFNVSWHLQGFGAGPLFISRVGDDERGRRLRDRMHRWGMDLNGLETDPTAQTGEVRVMIRDGQPSYDVVPDRAFDRIGADDAPIALPPDAGLLYHGTLAARSDASRRTLLRLRAESGLPAFVDVNLRAPWWNEEGVAELLRDARWIKLNIDELRLLSGAGPIDKTAERMANRYGAECVIVTRGEEGASAYSREKGYFETSAPRVDHIADTVGAGDAFSASMILGILRGRPVSETLRRATAFAAEICRVRGAISEDRELYRPEF